ncbi:hypothetical protein GUITHDRAFT_104359 [Guillardia theta CCMP2712]|uniref:Transmembrane protein n=2 Tax=Guillardia theta TaxID=55529 RepID=L1JP43_GUITC|nr:hypothetical protein GUITHDRAFT_104359 [Guillardia theta CCMP2712]EKX49965.1 hypothetical protein GUITHDRAFT_104359 [Guillardia theta CCMP2712]|mmetsp:Transcript_32823/g.103807  ORF Transcript_32823/g.103807 Transcript_32823/m.103807 type:complete len:129 (+) Transcript_32823:191-577(+)|eukprot:XP_005836945.1 hypothetical protein GUITHDRAFT_104359 [Guillardia theta CCMP2712]
MAARFFLVLCFLSAAPLTSSFPSIPLHQVPILREIHRSFQPGLRTELISTNSTYHKYLAVESQKSYRRKNFSIGDHPVLEFLSKVLEFGKGIGAFFFISAVAHIGFGIAAGPKRTSPPPVRTTTGLPY